MEMTPERWGATCGYLRDVFGEQDDQLASLMKRAIEAGLPDIAVSPEVGRLIGMLASMSGPSPAGSELIVEIGTLAGYSGIWLARGLSPTGRLITVELEPAHAAFAGREFEAAGVGSRVDQRLGAGLDLLPRLLDELGPDSVDLVFLDAVKAEYNEYFETARQLVRVGGLILADNALGAGWWIGDPAGSDPGRDAMDRFNRMIASDASFSATCVPLRSGVAIARRLR